MTYHNCGKTVCGGSVFGKILNITNDIDFQNVSRNDIIILNNSDPKNVLFIMNAGGVIIRNGGIYAHSCLLAMELGKPSITQVGNDIDIEDGTEVVLDANECLIYEI